ncbi:MAG TPA: hypothetical protein PKC99_00660 [Anaerolineales bacterium]|jgi:hypothetical protein|nr:hypothetical protein [Anaerolineales bacterium]
MARIVIYLPDPEMTALHQLAQQEYRAPKVEAAWIIRNELQRRGLVSGTGTGEQGKAEPAPQPESGGAA